MISQPFKICWNRMKKCNQDDNWFCYIIALSFLIQMLDTTVVNTAIPQMSHYFAVSPILLKISITSYLLSLALFIPTSSYLANRFGSKKIFMAAIIIFMLGSIGCSLSHHLTTLIIGRVIQGLGGAWISPVGRLLLMQHYDHNRSLFMKVMSHYAAIGLLGSMLGPAVGGFLTYQLSWQWIFYINLPIGLFILIAAYKLLPNHLPVKTHKFDLFGFLLLGITMIAWVISMNSWTNRALRSNQNLLLLSGACLLLVLYIYYARRNKNCLLPIDLFSKQHFRLAFIGNLWFRLCLGGIPFLIPLILQLGLSENAQQAGLAILPYSLGLIFAKRYSSRLLTRLGFKRMLMGFGLLTSLLLFFMAESLQYHHVMALIIILPWLGFVVSTEYSAINLLILTHIEKEQKGHAATYSSILQQIGNCSGICLTSLLLICFSHDVSHASFSLHTFHLATLILSTMTIVATVIFLFLHQNDGLKMR
ncbi:MAG: MFS transporter [Gammaproteobacteria bacterium]|nr:MFS transporter [Gammaproteobacteria bacterium]